MLGVDDGDSGDDGLYTFEELAASAVGNRVFTAEMLLDEVLAWCDAIAEDAVADACAALEGWDRRVNLDSTAPTSGASSSTRSETMHGRVGSTPPTRSAPRRVSWYRATAVRT